MDSLINHKDNESTKDEATAKSKTSPNTEVFILPPHILRKYGINLESFQSTQENDVDAAETYIGKSAKISESSVKTNLGKESTDKPYASPSIVPNNKRPNVNIGQNVLHENMCSVSKAINAITQSLKNPAESNSQICNVGVKSILDNNVKKTNCTTSKNDKKVNITLPQSSSIMETASLMRRSIFLSPNMIDSYQTDSLKTIQSPQSIDKQARRNSNESEKIIQQKTVSLNTNPNTNLMGNSSQNDNYIYRQGLNKDSSEVIHQNNSLSVDGKNILENHLSNLFQNTEQMICDTSTKKIKHNNLTSSNFPPQNIPYSISLRPQDILIEFQSSAIPRKKISSEPQFTEGSESTSIIKNKQNTGKVNILSQCIIKPNQLFSSSSLYDILNKNEFCGFEFAESISEKKLLPNISASHSIVPEISAIENIGTNTVQPDSYHKQFDPELIELGTNAKFIEEGKQTVTEHVSNTSAQNTSESSIESSEYSPVETNVSISGSLKHQDITIGFNQLKNTEYQKMRSNSPVKCKNFTGNVNTSNQCIDSSQIYPSPSKINDAPSKIFNNKELGDTNFVENDPKLGTLISNFSITSNKNLLQHGENIGGHLLNVVNRPNENKETISQIDNKRSIIVNPMEMDIINSSLQSDLKQHKTIITDHLQVPQLSEQFFFIPNEEMDQSRKLDEIACVGPNYTKEETQKQNSIKLELNNLSCPLPFCNSANLEVASNIDRDAINFNEDKPPSPSILSVQRSIAELLLKFHSGDIPPRDSTNNIDIIPGQQCNADMELPCSSFSNNSFECTPENSQNETNNANLISDSEQICRNLDQVQNVLIENENYNAQSITEKINLSQKNQDTLSDENDLMMYNEGKMKDQHKITPTVQNNHDDNRCNTYKQNKYNIKKLFLSQNIEKISNDNVLQNNMDLSTLTENVLQGDADSNLDIENNLFNKSNYTDNTGCSDYRFPEQIPQIDSASDNSAQNINIICVNSENKNKFGDRNNSVALADSLKVESEISGNINEIECIPINTDFKSASSGDSILNIKSPEHTSGKINNNSLQGIKICNKSGHDSHISCSSDGSNVVSDERLQLIANSLKKAVRQAQFKVYKRVPKIIKKIKQGKNSVATYSKSLARSKLNNYLPKHNETNKLNLSEIGCSTAINIHMSSDIHEKAGDFIQASIFHSRSTQIQQNDAMNLSMANKCLSENIKHKRKISIDPEKPLVFKETANESDTSLTQMLNLDYPMYTVHSIVQDTANENQNETNLRRIISPDTFSDNIYCEIKETEIKTNIQLLLPDGDIYCSEQNTNPNDLIRGIEDNDDDTKSNLKHSIKKCLTTDHIYTAEHLSTNDKDEELNVDEDEIKVNALENLLPHSNDYQNQHIPTFILGNKKSGDISSYISTKSNLGNSTFETFNNGLDKTSDYSGDNLDTYNESYFDDQIGVGEEVIICGQPQRDHLLEPHKESDNIDNENTGNVISNCEKQIIKVNDNFTDLYSHTLHQNTEHGDDTLFLENEPSNSCYGEVHSNKIQSDNDNDIDSQAAQFIPEMSSFSLAHKNESNLIQDFCDKNVCSIFFEHNDTVKNNFSTAAFNLETPVDKDLFKRIEILSTKNYTNAIDDKSIQKENLEEITVNDKLLDDENISGTGKFDYVDGEKNHSQNCTKLTDETIANVQKESFQDKSFSQTSSSFIGNLGATLIIEKLENVLNNLENDNLNHVNIVGESNSDNKNVCIDDHFPSYFNEQEIHSIKDDNYERSLSSGTLEETEFLEATNSSNLSQYSRSDISNTDVQSVTETIIIVLNESIDKTETNFQSDSSFSFNEPASEDVTITDNQPHYETIRKNDLNEECSIPISRKRKSSINKARSLSCKFENKKQKLKFDTTEILKPSFDFDPDNTNPLDDQDEKNEDNVPLNIIMKKMYSNKQRNSICTVISNDEEKKITNLKSNNCNLPKVAKFKGSEVKCAECKKVFLKKLWPQHNLGIHNNLAWKDGDKPIDSSDDIFIISVLRGVLKNNKCLYCYKCKSKKKSVDGFISHQLTCGKSEEEINLLKVPCHICLRSMLPASLKVHLLICQKLELYRKNKKMEDEGRKDIENVETLGRKRKAAEKAKLTIKEFGAALTKRDGTTGNWSDNVSSKRGKEVTTRMKNKWLKQINESKDNMCNCINTGCSHKENDITKMSKHILECPMKPQVVFQCDFCNFKCSTRPEIISHALKCSENKSSSETDVNPQNLSSESDDNDDHYSSTEDENDTPRKRSKKESNDTGSKTYKFTRCHYNKVNKQFENSQLTTNWMKQFCTMNYSGNVFMDKLCLPYRELTPLQKNCHLDMLQVESCNIAYYKVKTKAQYEIGLKPLTWKKYRLFESEIVNDSLVFFCGGTVNSIAWLPLPQWSNSTIEMEDHLAISVTNDPNGDGYIISDIKTFPNVIQLWSIGKLRDSQKACTSPAKMVMGLAHNHGNVWDLKWCPSGCFDLPTVNYKLETIENDSYKPKERLGLLAAACSDGDVCVFSIAHPSKLPSGKCPLYRTDPVIILRLSGKGTVHQPTKISWSESKGHSIISAGYSNGIIALFDISVKSPLVCSKDANTYIIKPYYQFQNTFSSISGLVIFPESKGNSFDPDLPKESHYDNELLIGFSSASGVQLISRVGHGRNSLPVLFRDDVTITSIAKMPNLPMLAYVSDEPGFASNGTWLACPSPQINGQITYKSDRITYLNYTSTVIDASPWVGFILQGYNNGMVKVVIPCIGKRKSRKKIDHSYYLSKFEATSLNQKPLLNADNEPKNLEEFSKNYGIVLTSFLACNPKAKSSETMMKYKNPNELPYSEHGLNLGSISQIESSRNILSSWYVAYACNAGVVNVSYFKNR